MGVFFLPFVLPAFAPRFKQEESLMLGTAHPPWPRFAGEPRSRGGRGATSPFLEKIIPRLCTEHVLLTTTSFRQGFSRPSEPSPEFSLPFHLLSLARPLQV